MGDERHFEEDDFGVGAAEQAAHDLVADVADMLQALGVPNVPDPEPPSPRQRLRITVPRVRTTLSLGSRAPSGGVRQEDTGAPNYDGFGVHSDGHLFVDIEETIGIQSEGSAFLQSQTNMAIGGKSSLVAGSRGGVLMAGGGGVTILGGAPNNWPANVDSDGADPQEPKWVAPINEASAWVTATASAVDAGLGAVAAAKAFKQTFLGFKPTKLGLYNTLAWAGGAAGTLASSVGVVGSVTSLAGWNSEAVGDLGDLAAGTLIYGQAGLIEATPITMGLYSGAGTTIGSLAGVAVNAIGGIELASVLDIEASSSKGSATLSAKKTVAIKGGSGVAIAAKTGQIGLVGKSVHIGAATTSDGQAETGRIALRGNGVSLYGKNFGTGITGACFVSNVANNVVTAGITNTLSSGLATTIESKKAHVSVTGKKHVELMCGETRVVLDGSQVMLGFGPGEAPESPTPPTLADPPAQTNLVAGFFKKLVGCESVEEANAKKLKEHAEKMAEWAKKCENLKKTKSGVIINDSSVEISVGGHKLTLDSGKVKHASLVLSK